LTTKELIESKEDIAKISKHLLGLLWPCEATRLIGLKVSNLLDKVEAEQMNEKNEEVLRKQNEGMSSVKKRSLEQEPPKKRGRKTEQPKKNQKRRSRKGQSDNIMKLDTFFEKKSVHI